MESFEDLKRRYVLKILLKEENVCCETEKDILIKSSLKDLKENIIRALEDLVIPDLDELVDRRRAINKRKVDAH